MHTHYEALPATDANWVPLSPVSFLARAAKVYRDRDATVYGHVRRTWADIHRRCSAVADRLQDLGIGLGDTVSVLAPNIPETFELHYAVPMAGAVLNTISVRLEPETIAYILDHGDSRLVFCDTALAPLLREAFAHLGREIPVIDIHDPASGTAEGFRQNDYGALAQATSSSEKRRLPTDEWQAIALNYTSGTSGRPKGVVYHHRGAYLMALGTIAAWQVPQSPTYLSVVPMFHCNGWNHPWAMAIVGGRLVFTRDPAPDRIFAAIKDEGVTHFGAAPIILSSLTESDAAPSRPFDPAVKVMTAGAPPPPAVLAKTSAIGLNVMQVYGLTESYGHISQCLWREDWSALTLEEQAELQAMQGVAFPMVEDFAVIDRDVGHAVPEDGTSQGEISVRGNTVMKGYYKDPDATAAAFEGGRFWSGDAAVVGRNGYVQITDRLKDVIISGGENISSVEVENALHHHASVQTVAVVARPDSKWGEVPCAFIELRPNCGATEEEIIAFCKDRLAGFKTPKTVIFGPLPKTATGKIQKYLLRERARAL